MTKNRMENFLEKKQRRIETFQDIKTMCKDFTEDSKKWTDKNFDQQFDQIANKMRTQIKKDFHDVLAGLIINGVCIIHHEPIEEIVSVHRPNYHPDALKELVLSYINNDDLFYKVAEAFKRRGPEVQTKYYFTVGSSKYILSAMYEPFSTTLKWFIYKGY